ncbi:MAG: bifunctional adenosylcobinamide kinase/adenosylcobinamide-phosphate guanylyltransferase [Neomegalonema sp.]|nr:bifunctional adenosylcobinamide kinase/adenosylcobinamide-phosphate guanylyltransferase [Neomegalonema sp.]
MRGGAPRLSLILGGARSGKSLFAERLAESFAPQRAYLATAEPFDQEMTDRIQSHRARRGPGWRTVEAFIDVPATLQAEARADEVVLIDCLTLWLSNEMLRRSAFDAEELGAALVEAVNSAHEAGCRVVAVSNEVGLGLVPETPLGRRFRDAQGRINQIVAASADYVVFVAAGLPLTLKGESPI